MLKQAIKLLKKGGVGVIPTDTIYGLLGSALKEDTVERIYKLRKRQKDKPMIILISSLSDLEYFNIKLSPKQRKLLKKIWPNPVSVVLSCPYKKFYYLHRGTKSIAFRIPSNISLINLLKITGPLVAPSANLAGQKNATTIDQAKKYFKDKIDFYINKGIKDSSPSTLIKLEGDKIKILRQGKF